VKGCATGVALFAYMVQALRTVAPTAR